MEEAQQQASLIAKAAEPNALHDMASLGRVHDVESLIQGGADREKADAFGRTAVHMAASLGHEEVVRMLARLGAKLELHDTEGYAPLHIAAHHGQTSVMTALLELRADVNSTGTGGRTPFHLAVDGLQPGACKLLPDMNADPEARDERNDTPLTLAVRLGHTLVLDALVDAKCDIHTRNEDGATALHLAACKQRLECIEVLVLRGARLESTDKFGLTPLHMAARTGEPEAADKLVEMKANVMSRTTVGRQVPLHLAAMADELETIDVLARAKASMDTQDTRGYTALHCAVEYDRIQALKQLLQYGAARDLQTRVSDTALHLSCLWDRPLLVQVLMRQGANVNARGRSGYTALHVSCELGSMACTSALLDIGNRSELVFRDAQGKPMLPINPNALDQHKQTPLHIATWHGRVELCDLLIQNNAEVDVLDSVDSTPLSLAVTKDHDTTVRTLLRLHADPMRRNAQELSALQLACVSGALSVAKTLAGMKLLPGPDEPPWRRPMALAVFYGHKDVAQYFFQPVPKNRLLLNMARAVNQTVITVTMTPIIAEPVVTAAMLHCIQRPEGWKRKADPMQRRISGLPPTETRGATDPFLLATEMVAERDLIEEEWLKGKTIQISDLQPSAGYLVRLIAVNDAGTTHGEIVEIYTKAPKDSGHGNERRRGSPLSASSAERKRISNEVAATQVPGQILEGDEDGLT